MKIYSPIENFPILIIEDFYSNEELEIIMKEINILEYFSLPPDQTGTAYRDGKAIKQNMGIFLDYLFLENRAQSKILSINRKIFDKNIVQLLIQKNIIWSLFEIVNLDVTLLSYYSNKDHYGSHEDFSPITVLSYFLRDNDFTGGQLYFPQANLEIQIKHNMCITMIGSLRHQVMPIISNNKNYSQRVCMSQFLFAIPKE